MRYKREEEIKKKMVGARVKQRVFKKIQEVKEEKDYPTIAKTIRELIKEAFK